MTKIELPENITILENQAFSLCTNVSEIIWYATNADGLSDAIRAFPNMVNNTSGVKVTFASCVECVHY